MSKKITNLIKNKHLIIITGSIGSGKSLLLTKLANHPQLGGVILDNDWQINDLPTTGNIFIDENILINSNYWENQDKIKKIVQIISSVHHNQQTFFLATTNVKNLRIELREKVDLLIKVKGITKSWWTDNKSLQLTTFDGSWKNFNQYKLPLHPTDFIRLERYNAKVREVFFKNKNQEGRELNHHD